MAGEENLKTLIRNLSPQLKKDEYVFITLNGRYGDYRDLEPIGSFQEAEGLTLIIPKGIAVREGLPFDGTFREITLAVHSSLNAVGLTAVVASQLSSFGISANVVAGFYHDHVFVQTEFADKALESLSDIGDFI